MEQKNQDMTSGSLAKGILFFSIPLMLSNILQVLFNMSDIAVVGHFAGAMALGSVGSTTILVTMFTGFLIGLSGGINVLVALYYGAKNERGVKETVHSAAILSLIIGVILLLFANRKIRKQPWIFQKYPGTVKDQGGAVRWSGVIHSSLFLRSSGVSFV